MKNFTTPELINPIIEDILNRYIVNKDISEFFPGVIASIEKPCECWTECFFLKSTEDYLTSPDFFKLSEKAGELYKKLAEFSEAVETYPGELWHWYNTEHERITRAINKGLIEAIA